MDGSVNRGQKREAELDVEDPGGHFTQRASHQKGLNRKADTSRDFPLAAAWMDLRDVRLKADKHLGDTVQARPEGKPLKGVGGGQNGPEEGPLGKAGRTSRLTAAQHGGENSRVKESRLCHQIKSVKLHVVSGTWQTL